MWRFLQNTANEKWLNAAFFEVDFWKNIVQCNSRREQFACRAAFRNDGDYYSARTTRSLVITSRCNLRQMETRQLRAI